MKTLVYGFTDSQILAQSTRVKFRIYLRSFKERNGDEIFSNLLLYIFGNEKCVRSFFRLSKDLKRFHPVTKGGIGINRLKFCYTYTCCICSYIYTQFINHGDNIIIDSTFFPYSYVVKRIEVRIIRLMTV